MNRILRNFAVLIFSAFIGIFVATPGYAALEYCTSDAQCGASNAPQSGTGWMCESKHVCNQSVSDGGYCEIAYACYCRENYYQNGSWGIAVIEGTRSNWSNAIASNLASQLNCTACPSGTSAMNSVLSQYFNTLLGVGANSISECKCPAGQYGTVTSYNVTCTDCAAGTYKASVGNGACSNCGAGYYCPGTGRTTRLACRAGYKCPGTNETTGDPCGGGYYQNETGKTTCKDCTAGNYCPLGAQTAQTTCPKGYKCPSNNMASATACSAGTFQASTGKTYCDNCNCGKYQNSTGQSSCKTCGCGTYTDCSGAKTSCTSCSSGTFQPSSGQSSCATPPYLAASVSQDKCSFTCGPGSYSFQSSNACNPCGYDFGDYDSPFDEAMDWDGNKGGVQGTTGSGATSYEQCYIEHTGSDSSGSWTEGTCYDTYYSCFEVKLYANCATSFLDSMFSTLQGFVYASGGGIWSSNPLYNYGVSGDSTYIYYVFPRGLFQLIVSSMGSNSSLWGCLADVSGANCPS